jgi:hypothetical protein
VLCLTVLYTDLQLGACTSMCTCAYVCVRVWCAGGMPYVSLLLLLHSARPPSLAVAAASLILLLLLLLYGVLTGT